MKIRPTVRRPSRGADEGWAVLSTLISGFVVFGGIGWLLDHWWSTRLMTPIGLVVGMSLGIYAVVMQFGRPQQHELEVPEPKTMNEAAALRAAKSANRAAANRAAANRAKALARTTAVSTAAAPLARLAHSPDEGPPPASTRRETECL